MSLSLTLTVRYEDDPSGQVVARIEEIPAAISFGATRRDARSAVFDALHELILSVLEDQPVAEDANEELVALARDAP